MPWYQVLSIKIAGCLGFICGVIWGLVPYLLFIIPCVVSIFLIISLIRNKNVPTLELDHNNDNVH